MPFIILEDRSGSKNLFYREFGDRTPLLFLHGGWGYGMYPVDAQIPALRAGFRILIPDRSGYGRSGRITMFPRGFHENASREMRSLLDALGIEKCLLWGHSDGAVTAVRMALTEPDRFPKLVLEAVHYDRCKPRSRAFFETAAENPRKFGDGIAARMAREHGEDYWEFLISIHGRAWLDILDTCRDPDLDLYSGRIDRLRSEVLLIHGTDDPRTEPGELEQLVSKIRPARVHIMAGAAHSPHSEPEYAPEVTSRIIEFLRDRDPAAAATP